jgi:hypothetical protein
MFRQTLLPSRLVAVPRARLAGALALVAGLAVYYAVSEDLPELSEAGNVAFLGLALMPAVLALVWLALPLRRPATSPQLAVAVLALGAVTVVLELLDLDVAANFTKLAAVAAAGWWFLVFFDAASWVLLVSLLIIPVDIVSVARGPTREIVENQPQVFDALSIAFPVPGLHSSAQLGLPDVLFFTLFLAAAARFGLRVFPTWVLLVGSFGATIAIAVLWDKPGLPALPLLSVGFLVANADLLVQRLRARQ